MNSQIWTAVLRVRLVGESVVLEVVASETCLKCLLRAAFPLGYLVGISTFLSLIKIVDISSSFPC